MSKNDPHILGKESIGKLLLQYSIPAIIGMTITSIYNIIDSIFIGHGVGAMAIAGFCRRFHARIYPARAERYERGYGNPVAHVNALYHQFFLFRNIVFYLPR